MSDAYPFSAQLPDLERELADRQLADSLPLVVTALLDRSPEAEARAKDAFRDLASRYPGVLEQMHARLTHGRLVRAGHLPH